MKIIVNTLTIVFLLSPEIAKMQTLALFITGNVNVILDGGGLGESLMAQTQRLVSSNRRWSGKSEQV